MAEVLDISGCEEASLAVASLPDGAAKRVTLLAGGPDIQPLPMLWPTDLTIISGPHYEVKRAAAVEAFFVPDVIVGGFGAHARKDGAVVFAAGVYPGYVKHYVSEGLDEPRWRIEGPSTIQLDQAFVISHFNLIYGHWLMEIFPKVFTIRRLAAVGVRAPVLLASTTPAYMIKLTAELLPDHELVLYDPARESVAVRMAILPSMQSVHYDYNPALSQDLDAFSGRLPLRRGWPDAVFVSRRALPRGSYRHLSNAAALERTAEALGLSIVHPQHMNWYDQVSLFANCRLLAGEFGSGLHNAIFSPAGTRVVTLNWIVDVQSRIANFRQQQVGYILPSDGQPRGYSIEPTMTEVPYEIDVDEFAARLEPLVSDLQRASDRPRRRKRLFPW